MNELTKDANIINNQSRKKYIVLCIIGCIALGILISLSGVTLAREGPGQDEARLIGVFVTTEHLDLPTQTGPISVPIRGRVDFAELLRPGRLYAQWCEETLTFTFPGIEGIPFFVAISPTKDSAQLNTAASSSFDDRPRDGTFITHGGNGIVSRGAHMGFGDNSVSIDIEGTIYAVPGSVTTVFMNQVFQTSDGQVFLESGSAFSFHGTVSEGDVFSTTLTETKTTAENGIETSYSMSVAVNHSAMFPPENIVLLQMNEHSEIIMRTALTPDEMEQEFHLEPQTEYVIVEIHRTIPTQSHGNPILREIIGQEDQGMTTFYVRSDGIIEKGWMTIVWPQGE